MKRTVGKLPVRGVLTWLIFSLFAFVYLQGWRLFAWDWKPPLEHQAFLQACCFAFFLVIWTLGLLTGNPRWILKWKPGILMSKFALVLGQVFFLWATTLSIIMGLEPDSRAKRAESWLVLSFPAWCLAMLLIRWFELSRFRKAHSSPFDQLELGLRERIWLGFEDRRALLHTRLTPSIALFLVALALIVVAILSYAYR